MLGDHRPRHREVADFHARQLELRYPLNGGRFESSAEGQPFAIADHGGERAKHRASTDVAEPDGGSHLKLGAGGGSLIGRRSPT